MGAENGTVARGSITGTVVDETKRPLAGATVCVLGTNREISDEVLRVLMCATTNSSGTFVIANLLPASYETSAAHPDQIPDAHPAIRLRPGEHVSGIDITLRSGGVSLGGTVADPSGGPIAGALVVASGDRIGPHVTARTDAQGRFAMWVGDDVQRLTTDADGYATGSITVRPPAEVAVVLTPEGTLAGTVIDATSREAVEGARVELHDAIQPWAPMRSTFANARGEFRFRALPPSRFTAHATTEHAYGRSAGSWLVGIAQSVTGAVVEVWPGFRVEARIAGTCPAVSVALASDDAALRTPYVLAEADTVILGGVERGTYTPEVWCGRDMPLKQLPLTVSGDVSGLVWNAPLTGTVRGVVRLRDGQPVAGIGVELDRRASSRTRSDGSFAIEGVHPGEARLSVRGTFVGSEQVAVIAGSVVERDLIVDRSGAIAGTVVDTDGAPVAGELVHAADATGTRGIALTDERGSFRIRGLRTGDHVVRRLPRETGVQVAVRDGEVASVQLTAPALRKQIRGVVRAGGEPVPDLYVVAAREDSPHARLALTSPDAPAKPVLTASDGTFTLDRLAEGTYVVRAYRRGGGEAQAEHVATGADIVLELAPTASIAGTVRGNGSVDSVTVQLTTELQTLRYESFHRTGGRFVIRDIPPGSYNLEIEAAAGRLRRAITLAPGEEQRLDLELQPLVAIVGRLVDVRSGEPVPGANVTIGYQDAVVADAAGQFRIERISPGPVQLSWRQEGVGQTVPRIVDNRGSTFDLGDVAIALPRSAYNASGNLGFELDENGVRVAAVTAASSLEVGDVIVAIDGIDVSGDRSVHALNLLTAPPGTSLALRLARGPTVAIIAGPRREFD